jgi:hypothetical protein
MVLVPIIGVDVRVEVVVIDRDRSIGAVKGKGSAL